MSSWQDGEAPNGRAKIALLKHLRDYLKRTGKTQKETAELAGLAPETVNRWLNEEQTPNPRLTELTNLASTLGISLPDLVSGGDPVSGELRVADETLPAEDEEHRRRLAEALDGVRAAVDLLAERLAEQRGSSRRNG